MNTREIRHYRAVQNAAKIAMHHLQRFIREGRNEAEIAQAANEFMAREGVTSYWYHGVGALVLVGQRTGFSRSGKNYEPTDATVGVEDLVTVDLSPQINSFWGDLARTFLIAGGKVINNVIAYEDIGFSGQKHSDKVMAFFEGLTAENRLHEILRQQAVPEMTYGKLYQLMNEAITRWGFENLDFRKNLGHSIEKDIDRRVYIEEGCKTRLKEKPFTLEPHISRPNERFGYKREDIYYFSSGALCRM